MDGRCRRGLAVLPDQDMHRCDDGLPSILLQGCFRTLDTAFDFRLRGRCHGFSCGHTGVDACRRGRTEVFFPIHFSLMSRLHGMAPETAIAVLKAMNALLPYT